MLGGLRRGVVEAASNIHHLMQRWFKRVNVFLPAVPPKSDYSPSYLRPSVYKSTFSLWKEEEGGRLFSLQAASTARNAPSFSTAITEVPGASSALFLERLNRPRFASLGSESGARVRLLPDVILSETALLAGREPRRLCGT